MATRSAPPVKLKQLGGQTCTPRQILNVQIGQVHAHGGGVLNLKGVYYWYGTSQKIQPGWISEGMRLYSSPDLSKWSFEGDIFSASDIQGLPFPPPYRIERPSVWYCDSQYIPLECHLRSLLTACFASLTQKLHIVCLIAHLPFQSTQVRKIQHSLLIWADLTSINATPFPS